jgi:hypothetical protein
MFKKSDIFILSAAVLSLFFSISLWFGFFGTPDREAGIFVGIWVPSILATGNYFKFNLRGK